MPVQSSLWSGCCDLSPYLSYGEIFHLLPFIRLHEEKYHIMVKGTDCGARLVGCNLGSVIYLVCDQEKSV